MNLEKLPSVEFTKGQNAEKQSRRILYDRRPKLDLTKFRWKKMEKENGSIETVVECVDCEVSFLDVNSQRFKKHKYV